MEKSKETSPRDPAKPVSYYRKVAASDKKALDRATKKDTVGSLISVPGYCLRVGLALYCTSDPVDECLQWFDEAVSMKLRFLEKKAYSFIGYATLVEDLDLYPAGSLVGRASELVAAYRRCIFERASPPRVEGLMDQLCAVLTDEPIKQQSSTLEDLKNNAKEWLVLPPLFKAVGQREEKAFANTLADFLSLYWTKVVRGGKADNYVGERSLLAAAVCKKMGMIPELPDKVKQYIPVDLIGLPGVDEGV
jgi:hypothetical protein